MSDLQEQEVRVDVVESVKAIKGTQLLCSILLGLSTSCLCVLFFFFVFFRSWQFVNDVKMFVPRMSQDVTNVSHVSIYGGFLK